MSQTTTGQVDLVEYFKREGALLYCGQTCAGWTPGSPVEVYAPGSEPQRWSTWVHSQVVLRGQLCALLLTGQLVRTSDGRRVHSLSGEPLSGRHEATATPREGWRLAWNVPGDPTRTSLPRPGPRRRARAKRDQQTLDFQSYFRFQEGTCL